MKFNFYATIYVWSISKANDHCPGYSIASLLKLSATTATATMMYVRTL